MQSSQFPAKFPIPFASGATDTYIRTIPQASQVGITPGAASLSDGFPPLTFQPVASGGVPPFGQDFNGILNWITKYSQWAGTGGLPVYDGSFSTNIGGYPQGAVLASTSPGVLWLNLVDNNTTNPDGGTPANWTPILTGQAVPQSALVHAGADTSSTANTITIPTLAPAITALANYQIFEVVPAHDITGPATIQIGGFGSVPLKRNDGADLQAGDGPSGQPFLAAFLNGQVRKLGLTNSTIVNNYAKGSLIAERKFSPGVYTYTPTPGAGWIEIVVTGGGGGGGGTQLLPAGQFAATGGGGSGGTAIKDKLLISTPGVIGATITVGAGGLGALSTGTYAGNGGASSFGTFVSATGGTGSATIGGATSTNVQAGGSPGSGSGGDTNIDGQQGFYGTAIGGSNFCSGGGGLSYWGGGGASVYPNFNGGGVAQGGDGISANSPGAGGSGAGGSTLSGHNGGNGGPGIVVIREYAGT